MAICFVALMVAAPSAHAAFPGKNGKIAFATDRDDPFRSGGVPIDIYTMNADGTNPTRLTNGQGAELPAWSPDGTKIAFQRGLDIYTMNADGTNPSMLTNDTGSEAPAWSPDGTKIAFDASRKPSIFFQIYTMNADGTNQTRLGDNTAHDFSPAWSPDGTKIAFVRLVGNSYEIYKMNADGTGQTRLTNNTALDLAPDWSPDGTKIAFETDRDGPYEIYTINADGTNPTRLTNNTTFDLSPAWSPDGTKIAFEAQRDDPVNGFGEIYTMNADGTNQTRLTNNPAVDAQPDWQPIPINSYPRPKGATPMRVSLVPAQKQCTAPNTTHGAPLAFGSCGPPQLASGQLTTGTPDSNGLPVRMDGFLQLRVAAGDVQIDAHISDVLNNDLSDYTGALRAALPLRITDKDNTPSPGGPGAGTTQPFQYGFDIPCTPDPAPTLGSDCSLSTTADALVPGTIKASLRTIWQIGRVRVDDAGPDGNPDTTADNTVFAVQGVFVP